MRALYKLINNIVWCMQFYILKVGDANGQVIFRKNFIGSGYNKETHIYYRVNDVFINRKIFFYIGGKTL